MLGRIALLLVGLSVSVIAAEFVLRLLDLAPTRTLRSLDEREFHEIPGIFKPNESLISHARSHMPHRVTTNSLGYRGTSNFPIDKPPGELRILVAGDSYAFGFLVDDQHSLPERLQPLVQAQCQRARVINAGFTGSTIVGQAAMIERGLRLEPDIVILVFHENDLMDLKAPMWEQLARNREVKSRPPLSLILPFVQDAALWNLALRLRHTHQRQKLEREAAPASDDSSEGTSAELRRLNQLKAEYLSRLNQLFEGLRRDNIDLFFVAFPGPRNLDPSATSPEGQGRVHWASSATVVWAENSARQLGIPSLNLQSRIREEFADPRQAYLLPHDTHPSSEGYRLAARAVSEFPDLKTSITERCRTGAALTGRVSK